MRSGGPGERIVGTSTPRHMTLVLLVFNRAFGYQAVTGTTAGRFAEAQALAWVTFAFTLLLTALQWKGIKRRFDY